jgi:hypothetical protein
VIPNQWGEQKRMSVDILKLANPIFQEMTQNIQVW